MRLLLNEQVPRDLKPELRSRVGSLDSAGGCPPLGSGNSGCTAHLHARYGGSRGQSGWRWGELVAFEARHAAEEAYRLVLEEGLPFREAYRRVAGRVRAGT